MVIDTENQTIKLSKKHMGKTITLPIDVIKQMGWVSSNGFTILAVNSTEATVDGDNIIINNGAKCCSYSAKYLSGLADDCIGINRDRWIEQVSVNHELCKTNIGLCRDVIAYKIVSLALATGLFAALVR